MQVVEECEPLLYDDRYLAICQSATIMLCGVEDCVSTRSHCLEVRP